MGLPSMAGRGKEVDGCCANCGNGDGGTTGSCSWPREEECSLLERQGACCAGGSESAAATGTCEGGRGKESIRKGFEPARGGASELLEAIVGADSPRCQLHLLCSLPLRAFVS